MTGNKILDTIVVRTREDVAVRKRLVNERDLRSFDAYHHPRRDFGAALVTPDSVSVIAEIKKASPSRGIIRSDFNAVSIARTYERHGASAVSVLTDEPFFQGSLSYLRDVSSVSAIPVLRKDFIMDPYQVTEARAYGADAVLLIVRILDDSQLMELHAAAAEEGLQVLTECYDRQDWDRLDFDMVTIAGVNNRNLDTFEVDLHRGVSLLATAPEGVVRVSESGLSTREDMAYLQKHGIHSALIGEHFMRAEDPGAELSNLTRKESICNYKNQTARTKP
ncbi:MAG: indole-3-glycerol phosphate synthase TrpC [Balneolaceae bacterium]|nr:MAG: indole-3-glycerol phosphate synthase TrpC [Balneolaceae bacterium]